MVQVQALRLSAVFLLQQQDIKFYSEEFNDEESLNKCFEILPSAVAGLRMTEERNILVLDLHVTQTDDGFTAEVPSIKGCESWAHSEEEAINKTIELLRFYLHSPAEKKMIIDKARKENNLTVYKLVFDK